MCRSPAMTLRSHQRGLDRIRRALTRTETNVTMNATKKQNSGSRPASMIRCVKISPTVAPDSYVTYMTRIRGAVTRVSRPGAPVDEVRVDQQDAHRDDHRGHRVRQRQRLGDVHVAGVGAAGEPRDGPLEPLPQGTQDMA